MEDIIFSNTPTFTLILLVLQTTLLRSENLYTLPSHNCTMDHSIVIGVIFSLIVIMPKAKFLVRVHPLAVSNIPIAQKRKLILKCEHIKILY